MWLVADRLAYCSKYAEEIACGSQFAVPMNFKWVAFTAMPATKASFAFLKVLVLDPAIVHVKLYENRFASFPASVDPTSLQCFVQHAPDAHVPGHKAQYPKPDMKAWLADLKAQSAAE